MSSRNEIKWAPFESLFHTQSVINELELQKRRCSKPILSSDTIEELENNILIAYHTKAVIKILYYYQGLYYEKKGRITSLSRYPSKIYLDSIPFYFEQIVQLEFI